MIGGATALLAILPLLSPALLSIRDEPDEIRDEEPVVLSDGEVVSPPHSTL
jgi:hypothetical protein